ncbi:uncharacterized protein PG998_012336 [Apiospora kogelbergensis]|uniref:uncharacterized protein n=1 Tax=Apiospora kogelbergensis TaxID=1337665 RepID=UPI00312EEA2C
MENYYSPWGCDGIDPDQSLFNGSDPFFDDLYGAYIQDPLQEYPQQKYPKEEQPPVEVEPMGDMFNQTVVNPTVDQQGFYTSMCNNHGMVPSVPSSSPTAPSSGTTATASGTPLDLAGLQFDQCRQDVERHRYALHEALLSKGIRYTTHTILNDHYPYRLYRLHDRLRDSEKARLEFMQVFSANRPYNQQLKQYQFKMSVVGYEPRDFGLGSSYPNISDPSGNDGINSPFEDDPVSGLPLLPDSPSHHPFGSLPATSPQPILSGPKSDSDQPADTPAPQRTKAIPKPDREVVKNGNGKYVCLFPDCTEEVKEFGRKCEWSKHMDKHDRPYKCAVEGCEKLPGFTYSGGLLRHEREVHGKHGGPKNPLNCPHPNCKRYSGKGFSRLENLNEHLRRVHTNGAASGELAADDHESIATTTVEAVAVAVAEQAVVGEKRKADDEDLRVEVKKLHVENDDLRAELDAQKRHTEVLQEQMRQLQDTLSTLRQAHLLNDHSPTF